MIFFRERSIYYRKKNPQPSYNFIFWFKRIFSGKVETSAALLKTEYHFVKTLYLNPVPCAFYKLRKLTKGANVNFSEFKTSSLGNFFTGAIIFRQIVTLMLAGLSYGVYGLGVGIGLLGLGYLFINLTAFNFGGIFAQKALFAFMLFYCSSSFFSFFSNNFFKNFTN